VGSRVCITIAVLLTAVTGHAHTLAGTIIAVTTPTPGIVTIAIEAEADPLIAKLEALAGVPASSPSTSDERHLRIHSLFPTLRANIDARIAGEPLALEVQEIAVDDTAQTAIRLTAKMPDSQPIFTLRTTFIYGAYQLSVTNGDGPEAVEWLQGPQTSTPIALEPPRVKTMTSGLTATRIGHGLAMGALVVYVIGRRRRGQRLAGG
jgi:hypothetical protein